jgi:hypothetical protein
VSAEPTSVRVVLPAHLKALAHLHGEATVDVQGVPTLSAVLDAIEAAYPVLRGTIRDAGSGKRRAFVRFYACEQDLSHEPADTVLPDPVVRGSEPLLVIGAMAGG